MLASNEFPYYRTGMLSGVAALILVPKPKLQFFLRTAWLSMDKHRATRAMDKLLQWMTADWTEKFRDTWKILCDDGWIHWMKKLLEGYMSHKKPVVEILSWANRIRDQKISHDRVLVEIFIGEKNFSVSIIAVQDYPDRYGWKGCCIMMCHVNGTERYKTAVKATLEDVAASWGAVLTVPSQHAKKLVVSRQVSA